MSITRLSLPSQKTVASDVNARGGPRHSRGKATSPADLVDSLPSFDAALQESRSQRSKSPSPERDSELSHSETTPAEKSTEASCAMSTHSSDSQGAGVAPEASDALPPEDGKDSAVHAERMPVTPEGAPGSASAPLSG